MHDIDFDEIDRAVNSVTNNDTETATVITPATPVPTLASTPEPVVSRSAAISPAARRTSGRFMDVVHPSSDMRPVTDARPPAPSAPSLHREEVARTVSPVSPRPEPAAVASSAFHWPDPIEPAQPTVEVPAEVIIPEPAPVPASEPEPVFTPETIVADVVPAPVSVPAPVAEQPAPELVTTPLELEEMLDMPLESPFLNDAKVEKRPLGAFSSPETSAPLIDTLDEDMTTHDPIAVSAEEVVVAEPVEVPVAEVAEADVEAPEEELLLEAHTETSHFKETAATPEMLAGPTSITQQYQEQPSTGTVQNGAIYDTDAYHQALVHPPKSTHKGLIVVWIAALLLVGGGIGAAVYFFVLPLL